MGDPVTEANAHVWIAMLELFSGDAHAARTRLESTRELVIRAGAGLMLPYVEMYLPSIGS